LVSQALRCAVLDDYQQVALASTDWSGLAGRVDVTAFSAPTTSVPLGADPDRAADETVTALADYDIVVAMRERTPFPAPVLARLPRLRLLVTTGMRNASIDVAAAQANGVLVCGTDGSSTPPVELTWALIHGLARNLVAENTGLRNGGPWQVSVGSDLAGATLGLVGLGKIGARAAAVGRAFGMDVVAWSQHLTADQCAEHGVRLAPSLHDLLRESDFASVHLVLGSRSRGLIDADALAAMKPTAYLINTARAAIVDQPALIEALRRGRLAGAGLDVFDLEPLPLDHPYRTLPNVLATPHLGYVTRGNYELYFRGVVEDIAAFLDGRPLRQLTT
jgi:phosphoglycerate dehydrogenase-like enzyme